MNRINIYSSSVPFSLPQTSKNLLLLLLSLRLYVKRRGRQEGRRRERREILIIERQREDRERGSLFGRTLTCFSLFCSALLCSSSLSGGQAHTDTPQHTHIIISPYPPYHLLNRHTTTISLSSYSFPTRYIYSARREPAVRRKETYSQTDGTGCSASPPPPPP